jgi:hypothetical protein
VSITPVVLHLRPGVREQYMAWLSEAHPELVVEYERLYSGAYAPKAFQEKVAVRLVGPAAASREQP